MNKNLHPDWKGYTLEELRFQRMLALAKADIGKQIFTARVSQLQDAATNPSTIAGKLTSALSYFDYAIIAFRLAKSASRLFHRIK